MIKQFIKLLFATLVIWIPIVVSIMVEKITEIITMNHIMTVIYFSIPIVIIALIKMEIQDLKEKE